jgi:hypothetical protein
MRPSWLWTGEIKRTPSPGNPPVLSGLNRARSKPTPKPCVLGWPSWTKPTTAGRAGSRGRAQRPLTRAAGVSLADDLSGASGDQRAFPRRFHALRSQGQRPRSPARSYCADFSAARFSYSAPVSRRARGISWPRAGGFARWRTMNSTTLRNSAFVRIAP